MNKYIIIILVQLIILFYILNIINYKTIFNLKDDGLIILQNILSNNDLKIIKDFIQNNQIKEVKKYITENEEINKKIKNNLSEEYKFHDYNQRNHLFLLYFWKIYKNLLHPCHLILSILIFLHQII